MATTMQARPGVSPEPIMRVVTGIWAASLVGAAIKFSIFTHVKNGANTLDSLVEKAGLPARGTQCLLDGLVGTGLLRVSDGSYANSDEADVYLVQGTPSYLGDFVAAEMSSLPAWDRFQEAVSTDRPVAPEAVGADDDFWEKLVVGIAPLSFPAAQTIVETLGVARAGELSILDVCGGSGVYSGVLLSANPKARSTQVDLPVINGIARMYVDRFGVGDRFQTVDSDIHAYDFGTATHDIIIYSHIAHMLSPRENGDLFKKAQRALKPRGALVINEFVLADDRSGPPFGLLFSSNMLLRTEGGASWRESDYRAWLTEAGFREIRVQPVPGPTRLIIAHR
jgi:ubiquinone/menaquinone biosynthesis C-methylase UbiE